jgi:CBS domain-containing protein/uncharacterized protein (DUF2267 family)
MHQPSRWGGMHDARHRHMSLEQICKGRLVTLRASATAYGAARAMFNNHVGAVLVAEDGELAGIVTDRDIALRAGPNLTLDLIPLREVMSPKPASVEVSASVADVVSVMLERHVRRVVVVQKGEPLGIVTLDDLILSKAASVEMLRWIVLGQLTELAPAKPEGLVRPARRDRPSFAAERRHQARRARSLHALGANLQRITGLKAEADALAAFEVVAANFMRRLTPEAVAHFTAQLPATLRERLPGQHKAPDRRISRTAIDQQVARRLGLGAEQAADVVLRIGQHLAELVSEGEVKSVAAQLPIELKPLVSPRA